MWWSSSAAAIWERPALCTVSTEEAEEIDQSLYTDRLDPDLTTVAAGSIGCGNSVPVAELHPGETVLGPGSGAVTPHASTWCKQ